MSWRTQGHYRGLSEQDENWIRDFDRNWDTKKNGRCRSDAFDHLSAPDSGEESIIPKEKPSNVANLPSQYKTYERFDDAQDEITAKASLEFALLKMAAKIARYTVPRQTKSGWSIHLIMKCGKRLRVHFYDLKEAAQAYDSLEQYSFWFIAS